MARPTRRWRYLVAVWAVAAGLTATTPTAHAQSPSSSSSASAEQRAPSFSVKCWRVETTSGTLSLAAAATDDACPVGVSIVELTAPFAPGDEVPAIWSVTLKSAADTTNALAMPLPPPATRPAGAVAPTTTPPTQISATFVRTCTAADSCDPTSAAASSSPVQTSNFTSVGEPLSFATQKGLTFDRAGSFPIAAVVAVRDAFDAGVSYVFAAYATVTIKAAAAAAPTRTEGVVRCRMSRQTALNATLDADASVSESSHCELRVALAPLEVVRPQGAASVAWVATLDRRDEADMHLPSPLTPVLVNASDSDSAAYEIVASYVKLCSADASVSCDEYTPDASLQQVASAGPASFSPAGNVTFTSSPVTLATAGRHQAMIHMVVAGPARRYDFLYYFTLLATAEPVAEPTAHKTDATTSYCWDVLADATRSDATAASVAAEASAAACPYMATLSLPAEPLAADTGFNLSWTLAANANYSALASPLAAPVALTAVYDPASQRAVSLPTLNVYACGAGTACSPFASDKTLLRALPARNFDADGASTIAANGLVLPSEGNYTIMVHSVFPNGASRVDTAVFAAVSVARAAPADDGATTPSTATKDESSSHTVTYVVVAVVCVVAVVAVAVGAVWWRRRRQRQRMDKVVQFGLFGTPGARRGVDGTAMHKTDSRGSFQSGDSGRGSFSFLRVQASQPSPVGLETPRDGSLSYDPYQGGGAPSFQDMSFAESSLSFAFTENERPSGLSHADDGADQARRGLDV